MLKKADISSKEATHMKKIFGKLISVILIMAICIAPIQVYAAGDNYTVSVPGIFHYDMAQEVLTYVNELRESLGVSQLKMDTSLMTSAMQRAAEIAVYFDHTRPDGSSCFSINGKMYGENIAAGSSTASGAYNQWYNSSGHYANMVNSSYNSIGIGCFSYGSTYYWVQVFGFSSASSVDTRNGKENVTPSVTIKDDDTKLEFNLNSLWDTSNVRLYAGDIYELEVCRVNPGWSFVYCGFSPGSFVWSSSDSNVASVDSRGYVTAAGAGTAVITAAAANGGKKATITVTVLKSISDAAISLSQETYDYTGKECIPGVTVYDGNTVLENGRDYTLGYAQNINAGKAVITVTGKGMYYGSFQHIFTINPRKVTPTITLSDDSFIYDGTAKTPAVTVKDGSTAIASSDYTVSYSNNVNAGTATVTVTLKGNYSGSASENYKIRAKEITPDVILATTSYTFDGTAKRPSVTVKDGNRVLDASDYTVAYSNNINPGTASVTVTMKGNYSGNRTVNFTIREQEAAPETNHNFINGVCINCGKIQDGFALVNGSWGWYKNGACQTSMTGMIQGTIEGITSWYYIQNGFFTRYTGFTQLAERSNNKWYYVSDGQIKTGWVKDNNKYYYFNPANGALKTGWVKSGGKYYYINPSTGTLKTGWLKYKGSYYYLSPSTGNPVTGKQKIGGKTYTFNAKGVCIG